MIGRGGGRDRISSEHLSRHEEKGRRSGWGVAPPSRHLWVGNLSSHVSQNALYEHFLRFGDIDDISYIPGRSFAFVNYRKEEDAAIALRGLQGFIVAGNPLRVEFAKGDRASASSLDDEYSQLNEGRYSIDHGDSLLRRDVRAHGHSPEKSLEKNKGNKSTEPSEVLWIGFPAFLNVDEEALRRAFAPFGEIESISAFPGRSYAFVRFRSIVAACRAKETLQGKLFNNPRVHIMFAKSDLSSTDYGRNNSNAPFQPHQKPNFEPGSSNLESSHWRRGIDNHIGDLPIASSRDASFIRSSDANFSGLGGSSFIRPGAGSGTIFAASIEHNRMQDLSSERRLSEELYDRYRNSPVVERGGRWHDIPFERRQRTPPLDDSWGVEDGMFPSSKKAKVDPFADKELPEYPFSDLEQGRHEFVRSKFSPNLPYNTAYNKGFESVPFDHKGAPQSSTMNVPLADREESRIMFDNLGSGSASLPLNVAKLHRLSPEPHQPPRILEWKWEGTIAKGGTPVCRARCFPVGKVLDFMLPEFLNCTARTGLDMLAKHYYQAISSWVVFFVPETDADIVFYNEFMHYLGEKQRAAVAKLGDKVTLFLVPPSEFSEHVLKVPGKVSISGVILKFQQPGSNFSSLQFAMEVPEAKLPPILPPPNDLGILHEDTSFTKSRSPDFKAFSQNQNHFNPLLGPLPPPPPSFPSPHPRDNIPYSGTMHPMEKLSDYHVDSRHDQHHIQKMPSHLSNQMHVQSSDFGSFHSPVPSPVTQLSSNSIALVQPLGKNKVAQGSVPTNYDTENSGAPLHASKFPSQEGIKSQISSNSPLPLQPEQLAQLAALLGQHKQSGNETALSTEDQNKYPNSSRIDISHAQIPVMHAQTTDTHTQAPVIHANSSVPSSSLATQLMHYQQQPANVPPVPPAVSSVAVSSVQQSNHQQADSESDPQKRLQATLQLAAALLQQIQQQSKTAEQ